MSGKTKIIAGATLLLAVLGGISLFIYVPRRVQDSPTKVRIAALSEGIDYAPFYVAKEKGWFEEALKEDAIGVDYTTFNSLPPVNESLASDRVDLVFEAEIPAIVGRSAGIDLRIVHMLSAVKAEEIVVPVSSKITTIQDLKGKRVAVMPGSGYHYALLKSLDKNGIARRDVTIVDMTPPDAKAAFETGAVDAWSVWPHWPEQEVFEGKGRLVKGLDSRVYVVTVARGAFADKHPKLVAKITAVLDRAKKWVHDNPDKAQEITSKAIGLRLEVVKLAWPKELWDAQITDDVITNVQDKADFLKAEGLIKTGVDVKRDLIRPIDVRASAPARIGSHALLRSLRSLPINEARRKAA